MMDKDVTKYCYILDLSDDWHGIFDTIEEAEEEVLSLFSQQGYKIAECMLAEVKEFFPCSSVFVEMMGERAEDEYGESADTWMCDVREPEENDLSEAVNKAIETWFEKHPRHKPKFFLVGKIVKHKSVEDIF